MNSREIPNHLLGMFDRYAHWRELDGLRHSLVSAADPGFDAGRCYLPEWAYLPEAMLRDVNARNFLLSDPAVLPTFDVLASWRAAKDIVEIDPDVLRSLVKSDADAIPPDYLLRLPSWAVYLPLPDNFLADVPAPAAGIMVSYTDPSPKMGPRNPVALLVTTLFSADTRVGFSNPLLLDPYARNLEECVRGAWKSYMSEANYEAVLANPYSQFCFKKSETLARTVVSMLLYVISEHEKRLEAGRPPALAHACERKVRGGWRIVPPKQPRLWKLGFAVGEQIRAGQRRSSSPGARARPCPHVRRGHWHLYWTGRRKFGPDEMPIPQVPRIRWLP
ncbi:MAG: hypothetical protein Q4F72_10445, partial [Desulfovibrionaceae bacterium]|nr:hypothetical protein [Desulfovibrionaceae bacterium]